MGSTMQMTTTDHNQHGGSPYPNCRDCSMLIDELRTEFNHLLPGVELPPWRLMKMWTAYGAFRDLSFEHNTAVRFAVATNVSDYGIQGS